jgi:hypothetical protein
MDNFTPALSLALGFTVAERSALDDDNTDFQHLASTQAALENFSTAWRQYRISLTEDAVGTVTPVFPNENFSAVPVGVPAGIFQRLIEAVDKIRAANAYTDEIGANLGIVPQSPTPVAEGDLKPVIKVEADPMGGYKFIANVTRLGQPAYKLQIQRKGSSTWEDAIVATSNPTPVTVTPQTPGEPERILVRAVLYKGSVAIGQPSDPAFVTVEE